MRSGQEPEKLLAASGSDSFFFNFNIKALKCYSEGGNEQSTVQVKPSTQLLGFWPFRY